MIKLRPYQEDGINNIAHKYGQGIRRIVFQMPTGSGKSLTFAGLIHRYIQRYHKSALICVHREELLNQSRVSLYNGFKINSETIVAGKSHLRKSQVYVAMVETLNNRLKKHEQWADHIGLVIVDEAHVGNHKKIYDYFPNALIIGFTATPLAASKKDPLKNHFDDIVTGPQISELIDNHSLCPNMTYSLKGIEPKKFGIKRGEYDQTQMANEYSRSKNVHNTVAAYRRHCNNEKTIIFNVNIDHSKLVCQAFIDNGYNCKHIDGSEDKVSRAKIFQWFKNTPDAILCNVGVATTGFDEPTIKNVIVNKSTLSLPLFLQMTGRASRPAPGKDFFRIIDMGANAKMHGDWSLDRNWNDIFFYPDRPSKGGGVPPMKECDSCEALLHTRTMTCPHCGHIHEVTESYDMVAPDFELLVSRINVKKYHDEATERGHKPFKPFFDILNTSVTILKHRTNGMDLNYSDMEDAFKSFEVKVGEWCKLDGRPFGKSIKKFAKEQWMKKVSEMYGKQLINAQN